MNEIIIEDKELVLVKDHIKDIPIDLKYSTEDNFTGKVIYEYKDAYLRYGTVKKLITVQERLKKQGYGLKIWDAFRTVEAQAIMWKVYPDDDFVADPSKGGSNHSRGNTVDVTVVDSLGNEIKMPTDFDDFEAMASYDYDDEKNKEQTNNAYMLKKLMIECGFYPSTTEWWHFRDVDMYPLINDFEPF